MFNTLSSNEFVPKGKKVLPQSTQHRQAHFDFKDSKAISNSQYESVTNYFYTPKERVPNDLKRDYSNASQVNLAQSKNIDPRLHYASETKAQFTQPENPQRSKQVRDKTDLLKSSYNLGEDKIGYSTTNSDNFYDKSQMRVADPRLKKPERYDIVTNKSIPKEVIGKSSNFDFWNQDRMKNRTSNNVTDHPMYGVKIDPITNRILPTSKNYVYPSQR